VSPFVFISTCSLSWWCGPSLNPFALARINERISTTTNLAATADHKFREKQAQFKKEQDDKQRRNELSDLMANQMVEKNRLQALIDPLRTKVLQKQSDFERARGTNSEEGEQVCEERERAVLDCIIELTFAVSHRHTTEQ